MHWWYVPNDYLRQVQNWRKGSQCSAFGSARLWSIIGRSWISGPQVSRRMRPCSAPPRCAARRVPPSSTNDWVCPYQDAVGGGGAQPRCMDRNHDRIGRVDASKVQIIASYDSGVITSYALYITLGLVGVLFYLFLPLLFPAMNVNNTEMLLIYIFSLFFVSKNSTPTVSSSSH